MSPGAAGIQTLSQQNFFAGAHPGMELIPDGSRRYHYMGGAEDIVNGLIDDDGSIFRRGGAKIAQNLLTVTTNGIIGKTMWGGYLPGGPSVVTADAVYDASGNAAIYGLPFYENLLSGPASIVTATGGTPGAPFALMQPVAVGGLLLMSDGTLTGYGYGGWPGSGPASASITTVAGSRTSTMSSTTGVVAGQFVQSLSRVVMSVDDATHLTLDADADTSATITTAFLSGFTFPWATEIPQLIKTAGIDAIGSSAGRLFVAQRNRVFFSARHLPSLTMAANDYHELPQGVHILGLAGQGSSLLVFATQGTWAIGNAELALTDSAGNPQQTLSLLDPEFVLWDHRGIAPWGGRLIVPGTQDVVLMDAVSAPSPLTGGIATLYRSYVAAGYQLGSATVFNGFYMLPVVSGIEVVDVLVCRLATGAWMRWSGFAACRAYVSVAGDAAARRLPSMYGSQNYAVADCSSCFTPTVQETADGDNTTHQLVVTTRSLTLGGAGVNTWRNIRVSYELTGDGGVTAETAVGPPGSAFTLLAGAAPAASEGREPWSFAKMGRNFRARFTSTGAPSKLIVRAVDVGVRAHQQV